MEKSYPSKSQIKTLKSAFTFLSRWNGLRAEFGELTISHKSLRIIIRNLDHPGNLLIACIEPFYICGPVRWVNCNIKIDIQKYSDDKDSLIPNDDEYYFIVADEGVGMKVICGSVEIFENVKKYG